jgi:hypothetical protein
MAGSGECGFRLGGHRFEIDVEQEGYVRRRRLYRDRQIRGPPFAFTVTVTLTNGVIAAVRVTPHATDPTSLDLQRRFAAAVPAVVVGKPIDQVKVSRLAGSSGTPRGFNAALKRIKQQAAK